MKQVGGVRAFAVWLASRAAMLALLAGPERGVNRDLHYYFDSVSRLFHGISLAHVLVEYPAPSLLVLGPQYLFSFGHPSWYFACFVLTMLAIDAALALVLRRASGTGSAPGLWCWLLFVPALGPITYARFDLAVGALAAISLLAMSRFPRIAGTALSTAVAVKLWPVLLFPTLLRRDRSRRPALIAAVLAGVLFAALTVLIGGGARLLSPLKWQGDRGLQIESLAATPLMLARRLSDSSSWHLSLTYQAWQIAGPGVGTAIAVSGVLSVVLLLAVVWIWVRWFSLNGDRSSATAWVALLTTLVTVDTDKTFSPQYLLWIGALVAALLVADRSPASLSVARLTVAIAALTQLVFPVFYSRLLAASDIAGYATLLLVVRNCLLGWLTFLIGRQAVRLTRRPMSTAGGGVPVLPHSAESEFVS